MVSRIRILSPLLIVPVLAGLAAVGCSGGGSSDWPNDKRPKVVVSFAPIYCFAKNVAGDDAVIRDMMTTTGPHNFNPTDADARLIRGADLFFVNGLGLDEDAAESLKKGSGNKKLKLIELAEKIPEDRLLAGEQHAGHAHGPHDPHVWLNPDLAVVMVETIRDELKAVDGAHAADYDRRAAEYVAKLNKLKADGLASLQGKADRKLVTFHESLSYFAKAYDLEIGGVVQKKPGVEPNSDELRKLVELCKEKKVRLIAVEPQYSTATSADAILKELKHNGIQDVALVEIDPLETVTPDALTPDWYVEKMRANLAALQGAMK